MDALRTLQNATQQNLLNLSPKESCATWKNTTLYHLLYYESKLNKKTHYI